MRFQSILNQLDAPLLVSSVPLEAPDLQEFEDEPIVPDPVYMMDVYGRLSYAYWTLSPIVFMPTTRLDFDG